MPAVATPIGTAPPAGVSFEKKAPTGGPISPTQSPEGMAVVSPPRGGSSGGCGVGGVGTGGGGCGPIGAGCGVYGSRGCAWAMAVPNSTQASATDRIFLGYHPDRRSSITSRRRGSGDAGLHVRDHDLVGGR